MQPVATDSNGSPPLAEALRYAAFAWQQFRDGAQLGRALELAAAQPGARHPRTLAAAQDIAYTATRHRALLDALIAQLAAKQPAAPIAALLAMALSQLIAGRHPAYAVVDQAVTAARANRRTGAAAGFINATLRTFQRGATELLTQLRRDDVVRYNAPRWWIDRLQEQYPDRWRALLDAQSEPPPLVVRVNERRVATATYLARLAETQVGAMRVGAHAVWLRQPLPVESIPGFLAGEVSVQDAGSQLAVQWLDVQPGQRVLDACAAPGGKTGFLAEGAAAHIDAIELDPQRAARIESNLARLGFAGTRVQVRVADAARPATWRTSMNYERILLDAPCSASGIVRRHPDIPWLRRPADVAQLATIQARLLHALWPLLAPTGRLLYVVCSLFNEEAGEQAARFLERHEDARAVALPGHGGGAVQLLPTPLAHAAPWSGGTSTPSLHDGFFYALFEKR
jgi:16S rRNA (cytosine967-C5)-methyltransferase